MEPPFSLERPQMRGITVGRFLTAHYWEGQRVIDKSLDLFRENAEELVP